MADRYWVGGTGNWSSTTKWSTTSGGASGASVPTSVDNVVFDANSGGKFTATVDTAQSVNSITITPSVAVGVQQIALSARLTTNNLTTTGTAGNRRIWFRGNPYGLAQDIVVNGTVSISDCDFRDIYVAGTAAPVSGTRIGDLRGCRGITFSTPKNCYRIGTGNWSANAWAATSGGAVSTNNFPLAQDTAVFDQNTTAGTHLMDAAIPYVGTVDMSARTSALTLSVSAGQTIYGNWINGSGTTVSGSQTTTFSGRNTQTITSAGKAFSCPIIVDTYGGVVELADALNIGTQTLNVINGTFDTKNFNVTAGILSSNNTNIRSINLGSSTVTLSNASPISFSSTNLSFVAGTSTIALSNTSTNLSFNGGGLTYYNLSFTSTGLGNPITINFRDANTFNNLTIVPSESLYKQILFNDNQVITGTLSCVALNNARIFLFSNTLGTQRNLTVGTLTSANCDYRDIRILGNAINSSPTRAGNCGGNSGIIFPAPKTVYWNAGSSSWSSGWATTSGGGINVNNNPLAQDTAVFDNTFAAGSTITINSNWNIGNVDMSARTTSMTLTLTTLLSDINVYGNWTFGTGVTCADVGSSTINFIGFNNQTITSNGVSFKSIIAFGGSRSNIVSLADAFSNTSTASGQTIRLNGGTFDAVSYNVTGWAFRAISGGTLRMGSGTWTFSGQGTGVNAVWRLDSAGLNFYKGTANIVFTNTSTNAREFDGGSLSYNKFTIGGTVNSNVTISDNNQFTELASTKTVPHSITLSGNQTFGKWTVTGTVNNVVTITGSTVDHVIAGARVSGVNYLSMSTIGFAASSPGEFYAGANSDTDASVIRTAAPVATTRYWVNGTGTWNATSTTNWSNTSGGSGGASVPTSADAVVFDAASDDTNYTVTCTGTLRCGSLTFAAPASGVVTWAGTGALAVHGNLTLPATGLTRIYNGAITFTGSTTGNTITTNGVSLASAITINGVNCGWVLSSALNNSGSNITLINGAFDTNDFSLTYGQLNSAFTHSRTLDFGASVIASSGGLPLSFGTNESQRANVTFVCGTSQLNCSVTSPQLEGNNQTFYNVAFTSTGAGTATINGTNTFNDLSFTGITAAGLKNVSLTADQTINGTLTLSAGTNATSRTFVRADAIGTTRTLTCAAFSGTDADFRDITIAGAAAPASGTRLGDCKGNSGITFDAPKTVYWRNATNANWGGTTWSATEGGTADVTQFPLAQDAAVFPSGFPNSGVTVTINAAYNIGTIDMSARTSNTMTLATSSNAPQIYGNWINGTGTTLTGTGTTTFAGRGSQTITSAGKTFGQGFGVNSPGGSVTLQDAIIVNGGCNHFSGTFDANGYNYTSPAGFFANSGTAIRTVALGSGVWTLSTSSNPWNAASTNLTVTGTGTISLTSASAKTFAGGGIDYSGITLNQGGAGILTITGNNTFADITNSYKATGATTIAMGTTTQRVANFSASGEAGRVLTVQGTSASSPATLVFTGTGQATQSTTDYLTLTGVRAYNLIDTWYAGANSTNNGSLGWYFENGVSLSSLVYYGTLNITEVYYGSVSVTAIYYGSLQVF